MLCACNKAVAGILARRPDQSSPTEGQPSKCCEPRPITSEIQSSSPCDNLQAALSPTTTHPSPKMIGRSALTRGTQLALRRDGAKFAQRRAYAATAGASTETASYESTDINGISVASRDPRSPTTRLTVVAKAGTRYQPAPGLSVGLEEFAFKASRPRHDLPGRLGPERKGR